LSLSSSFLFGIVDFRMIGFKRSALSGEVFFFTAIVALFFLFWNLASFLCLSLKVPLSFSKRRINFPIHFVGMPFRFALKMGVLVISLVFLGPSSEIVVEACGCRD
jgi:hypothetical protein